jgi:hypothetical protein
MSMDSGLTFSRSPIRCHLYSTSTCGPTLPRHRRDIADRESNLQVFSVVENPDFRSPTPRDLLTRVHTIDGSEPIGVSLLAISPLPLHQLGAPTRDMPICDVKCDLTVPVTPDRRLYFLLSFEPLPPCAQTCNFPCKLPKHDCTYTVPRRIRRPISSELPYGSWVLRKNSLHALLAANLQTRLSVEASTLCAPLQQQSQFFYSESQL